MKTIKYSRFLGLNENPRRRLATRQQFFIVQKSTKLVIMCVDIFLSLVWSSTIAELALLIKYSTSNWIESDGVYHPSGADRPNPFLLSKAAHHGEAGLGSKRSRNAMLVFFGKNSRSFPSGAPEFTPAS
jgi:hypothetical protein